MNYPRRTEVLLGTITLSSTICFFIPFSLFLLNREAFFTVPHVIAGMLSVFTVLAGLLLGIPMLVLKEKLRVIALSLLAFLCIGVWMQANLLNWDYGLLDGSTLRWQLFEKRSLIDVTVWTILFFTVMITGIRKKVPLRYVFFILLFMQGGNTFFSWINSGKDIAQSDSQNYSLTHKDRFSFSTQKNIILLVLDAYATDIFNENLEKNPDFKENLPGFIYYPNAVSEHYYTSRSIPTLLTGNYLIPSEYPNSRVQKEYEKKLFREHSIPALLKKSGYHVGIYPFYAKNNYPPKIFGGIADNYVHSHMVLQEGANEIATLMEVSLFRIAAHPLKKMIHNRFLLTPSFEQDRDEFCTKMQHLQAGLDVPAFKYYHLQGMHGPHIIDGNRLDEQKRNSALDVAAKLNTMLADFSNKLQEIGVYDNSDIFVLADHGFYNDSKSVVYGEFTPEKKEDNTRVLDAFVKKCRAIPLFMHKPAHAVGPMHSVTTPVCLSDVLPTITDIAGIEATPKCDGLSLQTLQEDTPRIRHHFTSEAYRGRSVVPDYEFYVCGFSWYDVSWTYTGNRHSFNTIERIPLNNYVPGQKLTFSIAGDGKEYLDDNWVAQKHSHTIKGNEASITLPLVNPTPEMTLELEVASSGNNKCKISVNIENTRSETFLFNGSTLLKMKVPYNPTWQHDTLQHPQKTQGDDIWDWSPTIPTLSEDQIHINIKQENASSDTPSTMDLISLCLTTPAD